MSAKSSSRLMAWAPPWSAGARRQLQAAGPGVTCGRWGRRRTAIRSGESEKPGGCFALACNACRRTALEDRQQQPKPKPKQSRSWQVGGLSRTYDQLGYNLHRIAELHPKHARVEDHRPCSHGRRDDHHSRDTAQEAGHQGEDGRTIAKAPHTRSAAMDAALGKTTTNSVAEGAAPP
jgi:hypothetical protein